MAHGSFESDGITVESSEHSSEALAANLTPDPVVATVESGDPPVVEAKVEAKPNPRKDPQARVEQATAKEAAAKRERDEAKAEAQRLAARVAELEARTTPKAEPKAAAPAADPEPTVDQFDSYEKFVKAQARWEARQEIRQQQVEQQRLAGFQERAKSIEAVDRAFGERYTAILAEEPEFPSKVDPRLLNTPRLGVLENPAAGTFGNFLVEQVFQSEHPKDLLLHLSDPATVQRLATLPPDRVIRELAKFEAGLGAASPAASALKTAPVSTAKAPIRPVGSSPVATDANEITDDLSVDEHIKRMNAKDRAARRAS